MTDLTPYLAEGYTKSEAILLAEHDENEELHSYSPKPDADYLEDWCCDECGDTSEGLMHNDTWRNVEPLLDYERAEVEVSLTIRYNPNTQDHPSRWDWAGLVGSDPFDVRLS